jgi:hypothetical protein
MLSKTVTSVQNALQLITRSLCSSHNIIRMINSRRLKNVANERNEKCAHNFSQKTSSRKHMRDLDVDWNIIAC